MNAFTRSNTRIYFKSDSGTVILIKNTKVLSRNRQPAENQENSAFANSGSEPYTVENSDKLIRVE